MSDLTEGQAESEFPFGGEIENVRIYGRMLTTEEIAIRSRKMSELPMSYDDEGRPLWTYDEHGHPQGPGFVMSDYTREQALDSVGPGWAKLVGALWDFCKIQDPPIAVSQVKEKYGTLRFYVGGVPRDRSPSVYIIIHAVEHLSGYICETCGEPGKLRGPGWYFTACNEHSKGKSPVEEEGE